MIQSLFFNGSFLKHLIPLPLFFILIDHYIMISLKQLNQVITLITSEKFVHVGLDGRLLAYHAAILILVVIECISFELVDLLS